VVPPDRIVADNLKIFDGGGPGVPSTQHVSGSQFVEEGGVGVDALAFKDSGCAFRERDGGRVKVARPGRRENLGVVHVANPTPPLPDLEPDSPARRLRRVVPQFTRPYCRLWAGVRWGLLVVYEREDPRCEGSSL
jgi:hypothetical protein